MSPATASLESRVGLVLGGMFRLERLVAQGGMGAIYEAAHLRLPRRFAVKLLHPQIVGDRDAFERFQREAEIASSIGHENIVEVFDFSYAADGVPYMVLEFLRGEDLSARIARRGQLTLGETAGILAQVASAVGAAHARGIVHRDLKPQNIFLCRRAERDDFVKVLDFGISKILFSPVHGTKSGQVFGTPNYMAPEQAAGRQFEIDQRSDIFSLGAILYECLAGKVAFAAPSVVAAIYQVCYGQPEPLRRLVPELPETIEQTITRALSKAREARQRSVAELCDEFLDACQAAGIPIHPASPAQSGRLPPSGATASEASRAAAQRAPSSSLPTPSDVPDPAARSTPLPSVTAPGAAGPEPDAALPAASRGRGPALVAGAIVLAGIGAAALAIWRPWREPLPPPVAARVAAPPTAGAASASLPAPTMVATITLRVRATPADARVSVDGAAVPGGAIELPRAARAHVVEVSAPGHATERRVVRADADQELVVSLRRDRSSPARRAPAKNKGGGLMERDL